MAGRAQGAGRLNLPRALQPLVLASASPRRAALLREAGLSFTVRPASVDESPLPGERPGSTCRRLAVAKARAAAALLASRACAGTVLGADTVVELDGRLLGKPVGAAAARAMLRSLSGRRHRVLTAVALVRLGRGGRRAGPPRRRGGRLRAGLASATVAFDPLGARALDDYIAGGEWADKAGAYALQGRAAAFAHLVAGRHDTVVGLPLALVERLLHELLPPDVPS